MCGVGRLLGWELRCVCFCVALDVCACYLFVGVEVVVAQHQVGLLAVQEEVGGPEGQREALHRLAEVKCVPQVRVGDVCKQVLKASKGRAVGRKTQ